MPWFRENRFYFYVIILLLLIMALRTPLDTDMWWHLRAGEETWLNRQVYSVDTFSFTRSGQIWLNHSWLSQVMMFVLFQTGGYLALSVWVAVTAATSMALVYFQMEGHSLLRGAILILAGAAASVVWSPRPQIMSLVLFGLVSYLLYLYKWKKKNHLIWLVPIFLIWGNLHGGYVLGVILLGVMIGGELLNKIIPGKTEFHMDWPEIRKLVFWASSGMLAVLINPFGIGMWKIPFNTVGLKALQDFISEWASPDFHQLFQQPMLWMLFLIFIAIGISKKTIDGTDLLSLIVFSWFAFTARRNFGPFAMVSAPVISRHLHDIFENWKSEGKNKNKLSATAGNISDNTRNWINLAIIVLLVVAASWKAVDVNKTSFVREKESEIFPSQAVDILLNENDPGKIFNEYNWGGYLIWHLRDFQVFVDGRTDLYGDEILDDYLAVVKVQKGWNQILDINKIDILLIKSGSNLEIFAKNKGWHTIYKDSIAVVLGR